MFKSLKSQLFVSSAIAVVLLILGIWFTTKGYSALGIIVMMMYIILSLILPIPLLFI